MIRRIKINESNEYGGIDKLFKLVDDTSLKAVYEVFTLDGLDRDQKEILKAMTLHSFQCIGYIPKIIRWILEGKERNLKVSLENLLSTIEQLKEESKDFYDYMGL